MKAEKTQAKADDKNNMMEGLKLQKKELEDEVSEYTNQSDEAEKQIAEMQVYSHPKQCHSCPI